MINYPPGKRYSLLWALGFGFSSAGAGLLVKIILNYTLPMQLSYKIKSFNN